MYAFCFFSECTFHHFAGQAISWFVPLLITGCSQRVPNQTAVEREGIIKKYQMTIGGPLMNGCFSESGVDMEKCSTPLHINLTFWKEVISLLFSYGIQVPPTLSKSLQVPKHASALNAPSEADPQDPWTSEAGSQECHMCRGHGRNRSK